MEDTSKYLIHAKLTADGVVERSDVVGAVFGQTEGLLGDDFDLRDLQQSSRVGRIDVHVESEGGQSFGDVTIASSLDKVETAILAASLETITRVGPCEARVEVTNIEDVRAAKRRIVVERAKQLLANAFEESVLTSDELHEEVRESVRAGDLSTFEGLPAGPNVADGDAVIVVEGRADVLRLLKFGIKNAIAVEGTNVPESVADLTRERTVTAFLDGDRGGELILRELAQVGDVDFVAFAPKGQSVEDLSHAELVSALREKTPYGVYAEAQAALDAEDVGSPRSVAATDGSATPAPESDDHPPTASSATTESPATHPDRSLVESVRDAVDDGTDSGVGDDDANDSADGDTDAVDAGDDSTDEPDREPTLDDHVRSVVGDATGRARLLDDSFEVVAETSVDSAFDAVESAEGAHALVFDGELSQRVLDVAAQRGLAQVVARDTGEFVKQPVQPHVRLADGFLA